MDLLKINVEGFEPELLKYSHLIISKLKPKVILVEIDFDDQYI